MDVPQCPQKHESHHNEEQKRLAQRLLCPFKVLFMHLYLYNLSWKMPSSTSILMTVVICCLFRTVLTLHTAVSIFVVDWRKALASVPLHHFITYYQQMCDKVPSSRVRSILPLVHWKIQCCRAQHFCSTSEPVLISSLPAWSRTENLW